MIEHITLLGHRDIIDGDALRHDDRVQRVVLCGRRCVHDVKLHRVDALALGIVPQLQLGLGTVFHIEVGLRRDRLADIAQPRALTADGIGKPPLVSDNGRRAHQKGIDAVCKVFSGEVGRLFDVLTEQRDGARHVGRRHGRTAVDAVAADDGRGDLAAVRRDLRLDLEVGRGAPRGEVGHEGARLVILVEVNGARTECNERSPDIRRDRTGGDLLARPEGRYDAPRFVVVDDTADCAVFVRNALFFLKGIFAARDDCDTVALRKRTLYRRSIVVCPAVAGHDDKVECVVLSAVKQFFDKVALLARGVARLVEVDRRAVGKFHIGGLLAGNGGNGERARIGRGRTDRAAVGIGCQVGRTVSTALCRASGI